MAVRVGQAVLTALWQRPATSPTTPDANTVAVTQAVLTALVDPTGSARVAQAVLTALMAPSDAVDTPGGGSAPTTHTFGYAV